MSFAASLLILVICGAEVGVRTYEGITGESICRVAETTYNDPSKLAVPSWSCYQELKPLAAARIECRDSDTELELRTNSLGLRGAEPTVPKPANVCRIIVLGDESILAPETAENDHFCTQLQQQLQQHTRIRIEVINAGVPGHCPLTEYLMFKQRLLSLQPDLVLMHFDWSDVADDHQIRRRALCDAAGIPQSCPHTKLVNAKKVRQCDLWRQQFRLMDWGMSALSTEWKQQLAKQKAASRDVETNPYAWLRDEHPEQNVPFRQSVKPIADLAQLCRSSYAQFVVLTSPKPWQVSAKCSRGEGVRLSAGVARDAYYSSRAPFKVLGNFANRSKIPFVDGSTSMAAGPDGESNFLRHAPRWSPQGHRRMAEVTANYLMQNIPGAWNSSYFQQADQPVTQTDSRDVSIQLLSDQSKPDRTGDRAAPLFR